MSGHSLHDLHPCFTPVLLLFPFPSFTSWNTAPLYIEQQADEAKKKKKSVVFFAHLGLGEATRSYCDKLRRSTDINMSVKLKLYVKIISVHSYSTTTKLVVKLCFKMPLVILHYHSSKIAFIHILLNYELL